MDIALGVFAGQISDTYIKVTVETDGKAWSCFTLPALDECSRYTLASVVAGEGAGAELPESNYYRSGNSWIVIDNTANEYYFNFTADASITRERAVSLPQTTKRTSSPL